jgi:hypothetical protein
MGGDEEEFQSNSCRAVGGSVVNVIAGPGTKATFLNGGIKT